MKEDGKDENRQVPASEGMVIRNCLVDTVSQDGLVAGGKVRIHGFKSINNGGAGIVNLTATTTTTPTRATTHTLTHHHT